MATTASHPKTNESITIRLVHQNFHFTVTSNGVEYELPPTALT